MCRPACLLTSLLVFALPSPSFAAGSGYWYSFKKYWSDFLVQQNGVVSTVLIAGLIGGMIIMFGGRWRK